MPESRSSDPGPARSPVAPAVLAELVRRGSTIATAESLTGGLVAATITAVPGASEAFLGGVVSYAPSVKEGLLGVPAALVDRHGTVSAECAEAMALGACRATGADHGVSTTGVAGPDPLEGHPVGTVFIGVAAPGGVRTRRLALDGDRDRIRSATVAAALAMLGEVLGLDPDTAGPGLPREDPPVG